jgi:hypothetical protein
VAAIVFWGATWIMAKGAIGPPVSRIVLLVLAVLFLLYFLQRIGLLAGGGPLIKV